MGYPELPDQIEKKVDDPGAPWPNSLTVRGRVFDWGMQTYVMGIINLSPDSFSGDGLGNDLKALAARLAAARRAGCHLLDIGAESTRPGSKPISATQEIAGLLPAISFIRDNCDLPISVDTYKASVAERALDCGADIINDISALTADPRMANLAAERACPLVLMHRVRTAVAESPLGRHFSGLDYSDVAAHVIEHLSARVAAARAAGIERTNLIVDPGIGFGKNPAQNLELLGQIGRVRRALQLPLLVGASRKSVIGHAAGNPAGDRLAGTIAAHSIVIAQGADIVRVHDFAAGVESARVADAISRRQFG